MKTRTVISWSIFVVAALSAGCGVHQSPATNAEAAASGSGMRYEAHVNAGGVVPPALPPAHPPARNANDSKAGEGLFVSMNCDGCHGGGATGWEGPSLVDGRWRYGGADEEVFQSIFYGRPKGMPAYGGVLGADGVWMILSYLRSQPVPAIVPTINYDELANPVAPVPASTTPPAGTPPVTGKPMDPRAQLALYGCIACHAIDKKVIGPSFRDVAAKYHNQPGVERRLELKVKNGGVGVWGDFPMPPNAAASDADLRNIINWILTSTDVRG